MHNTGPFGHQLADVLGVVERPPVGRISVAPDGLLEIGALVLRGGLVYMVPRCGISGEHLSILVDEAQWAALHGGNCGWLCLPDSAVTLVRVQASSSSESRTACASSSVGRVSLARRFQANA